MRGGTIFEGQGTQSRTSGAGAIFDPEKENLVDVFCVHASHSISTHSGLSTMIDVVPRKVEDVLLSPQKSQRKVWNAAAVKGTRARVTQCPECNSSRLMQTYEAELVCIQCGTMISPTGKGRSAYNRRLTTMSGLDISDDLVANLDEMTRFNREVEKMLSKIPADLNNQTGIVIIDSGGVLGLEMFDHPDSWRAFSRSIVRNYVDVLAKERAAEHLFALRTERIPQAIRNFLKKAEKLSETSVLENRVGKTAMLSGELAGEYTIMGSELIHLILKRKTHVHAHASPRYLSWLSSRLFQNRF